MHQLKQKRVWINQDAIDGPHCTFHAFVIIRLDHTALPQVIYNPTAMEFGILALENTKR